MYDGTTIVVRRTDTVGNWLGSAIYTGRIDGSKIDGTVRYANRDAPHDPRLRRNCLVLPNQ